MNSDLADTDNLFVCLGYQELWPGDAKWYEPFTPD